MHSGAHAPRFFGRRLSSFRTHIFVWVGFVSSLALQRTYQQDDVSYTHCRESSKERRGVVDQSCVEANRLTSAKVPKRKRKTRTFAYLIWWWWHGSAIIMT